VNGKRAALIAALVITVVALVGSVAYAAAAVSLRGTPVAVSSTGSTGMMGGSGVMGTGAVSGVNGMASMPGIGQLWLSGNGRPVASFAAARSRATAAAKPAGLHPGEVIWFDNGFYVELKDTNGRPATEVIVDLAGGAVRTEPGPAMMWNTRYGMHTGLGEAGSAALSQTQAGSIAQGWLDANQPGVVVVSIDPYPGYFTADVGRSGKISGMLSVNATTGRVWFHSWHGTFIAREDA
jgi:hypothetical protein